jgi:hypothetical protein
MKKGLLTWEAPKSYLNIGDYIQSVAAEQYTGQDVVYVKREETYLYSGEPIKLIMNGWFMLNPENWPPSKKIHPLFVSFHLNPSISERLFDEKAIEYFKDYVNNYGPIGCRDKGTEKIFKSKGIPAYFSGCLTLTLKNTFRHNHDSENICFVDPFYKVSKGSKMKLIYLYTLIMNLKVVFKISKKLHGSLLFKKIIETASFYRTYSMVFKDEVLAGAEYINHSILESSFDSEASKLEHARKLLKQYANSTLVVTSRIHAALPCIGMGTPVIFIISNDLDPKGQGLQPKAKGRFEGILNLFHVVQNVNNKLKPVLGFMFHEKIGFKHSIQNKQDHLKMANELDKVCTAFIKDSNLVQEPINKIV